MRRQPSKASPPRRSSRSAASRSISSRGTSVEAEVGGRQRHPVEVLAQQERHAAVDAHDLERPVAAQQPLVDDGDRGLGRPGATTPSRRCELAGHAPSISAAGASSLWRPMPATALPPGPRYPRALQTLGWGDPPDAVHGALPGALRGHLHVADRAGGHVGLPRAPRPGAAGVHRRPAGAARRRGQRDPAAGAGPPLRAAARRRAPHGAAQAAAPALPRRAHAALRRADARDRGARGRQAGPRASRSSCCRGCRP